MKSEKGITLISLIIYVIAMLVVVTIVGTITSYFYANVNDQYQESKEDYNETNLDMYLINDLKNKEISITDVESEEITNGDELYSIKLEYNDGYFIIYTITDHGIYRNKVKIYNSSNTMAFRVSNIAQDKKKLEIISAGEVFKSYTVNTK